jgi:hypothetical protein
MQRKTRRDPGDAFLQSLCVNTTAVAGSNAADEHLGLLDRIASVLDYCYRRISRLLGPLGEAKVAGWALAQAL